MSAPTDLPPESPPDLEYVDPLQRVVDVDAVIRRARRARSRRRALAAVAGLAAVVTIGGVAAESARPRAVTPAATQDPTVEVLAYQYGREHPPATTAVVIDDSARGWDIVAWISTSGEFCGGVLPTAGQKAFTMGCWVDTRDVSAGTWRVLGKPIFQALPQTNRLPANSGDRALAIGAVAGDATHVQVVFRGNPVEAPVVGLPTDAATTRIGAYALWVTLKPGPVGAYGSGDISTITAADSAGRIVAHLP